MTNAPTPAAFLAARLDEDEAAALVAADDDGERWAAFGLRYETFDGSVLLADSQVAVARADTPIAAHIARHDPARVLAEVASKRAVLALHQEATRLKTPGYDHLGVNFLGHCETCAEDDGGWDGPVPVSWPCPTLRNLAAVYSDHADYDESWRP